MMTEGMESADRLAVQLTCHAHENFALHSSSQESKIAWKHQQW